MSQTESPQDSQQPGQLTLSDRVARLGELLNAQAKTGHAITDEDLAGIGYVRIQVEDSTKYVTVESLAAKPSAPTRRNQREQRTIKHAPFSPITFEVETSGKGARLIPEDEIYELRAKLSEAETMLSLEWHLNLGENHPLTYFLDDFDDFFQTPDSEFPIVLGREDIPSDLLRHPLPFIVDEDDIGDGFFANYLDDDQNGTVPSENAERMHTDLARAIARHADVERLRIFFGEELTDRIADNGTFSIMPYDDDLAPIREFLNKKGIITYADFIRFALPMYLEHLGLHEMAQVIQNAPDLTAINSQLNQIKIPVSDEEKGIREKLRGIAHSHAQELAALRQQRKEAQQALDRSTGEEKHEARDRLTAIESELQEFTHSIGLTELNEQLKELEEEQRHLEKIRRGILDYFDSPSLYAQLAERSIKNVQDYLERGSEAPGPIQITLDPTPNAQLDEDPGKISGDCTEGKPLPFYRQDTHNVKVFKGTQHIGNIYLLETTNYGGERVWHLDAIQIPLASINARLLIQTLVEQLGQQAKANGVAAITVDGDEEAQHISNYDYIQEAAEGFWEQQTEKETMNVVIPNVYDERDTVSQFQGSGMEDLVLWRDA